ncbi:Uncharacterised protein [Mycobacteroides abscessus subsp. abscessus]|nr:Uncharacterised protein [Mycobacteroides abscessus subsp. abscessus]
MTRNVVRAIAGTEAPADNMPIRMNSTEPANSTPEMSGASHQGRPWAVTTTPNPIPRANSPAHTTPAWPAALSSSSPRRDLGDNTSWLMQQS